MLDLNNKNKIIARNSVFKHYDRLEKALDSDPNNELLLKRLSITSNIIKNIDGIFE